MEASGAIAQPQASAAGGVAGALRYGSSAFVLALPGVLASGLIAFAPLGPNAMAAGITAALLGAAMGSVFCNVLAGTRGVVLGPTSAIALITGGVFVAMIQRGELAPDDTLGCLVVLILLGLLVAAFQLLMAVAQIGRLIPLLPYPVIKGLVNGTAALLLLSQVPMVLGVEAGGTPLAGAVLVAAVTFWLSFLRWPWSLPAPAGALLVGVFLHYALAAWAPGLSGGAMIGAVEPLALHAALLESSVARIGGVSLEAVFWVLVPAALSIAIVSAILMMASVAAIGDAGGPHGRSRRDMLALGTGNLAAGASGGLSSAGLLSSTLPLWHAGSRGAGAPLLIALLFLGLLLMPWPLLGMLPVSALAGVVCAGGAQMIDLDVFRLLKHLPRSAPRQRADMIGGAAIAVLVTGTAIAFGLVVAISCGLVLALLVFASVMAHGPIRRSYACPPGRSRIRRGPHEQAALAALPDAIRVVEVEGAVFFGNIDGISQAVDQARAQGAQHVLLDMSRVAHIDISGARRLVLLCERNWQAGLSLAVTPLRPGHPVHDSLEPFGLLDRLRAGAVAETLEAGLARAEDALLASIAPTAAEALQPAAGLSALGLPPDAVTALLAIAQDVTAADGAVLMRAGDPADAVYLLLVGALDVTMPRGGHAALYIGRLMPGALFGEMALISGAPRSADVVAHGAVRCLRLGTAAIDQLRVDNPDAAYALLAGMARQVERNLRLANMAMAALEE